MRSYRDILATRERKRPDGSPVWPIRDADLPSRLQPVDDRRRAEVGR